MVSTRQFVFNLCHSGACKILFANSFLRIKIFVFVFPPIWSSRGENDDIAKKACGILSLLGKLKYTEKLKMYVTDGDIQYSTIFSTEKGKLHIYWNSF